MSQALMDYVSARHAALVAVLDLLAAEYRLSDEDSSALAVAEADGEAERAARALTAAVYALPEHRRPVGWAKPPAVSGSLTAARARFTAAALRCLSSEHAGPSSDADAEAEYASELIALAARNLIAERDALTVREVAS